MKKHFNFKSMYRAALVALCMLSVGVGNVWGDDSWYELNNSAHIYFNDYTTNWVSDPSSNGICFLIGRDYKYNNDNGADVGSRAYRMSHIANTKLWYKNVPSWGTGNAAMYQYIAFRYAPGTTGWDDWAGGWDWRVTPRASYDSNTKYSITKNYDIVGKTRLFLPQSSSSNTDMNIATELTKYTAYLRVKYDENRTGTYGDVISGSTTWPHGVTFDFTGTYMTSASASAQSTIYSLTSNGWDSNSEKGYDYIPVTGEVRFELKGIDTGFELAGWAYADDATTPAYTTNPNDVTFQVLGNTNYVAFVRRKQYTINLANMEADEAGTTSVTVKYGLSDNMTSAITPPEKAHYDFGGYFVRDEETEELTDIQLIDADGNWIKNVTDYTGASGDDATWVHDYPISLYAKWTEHEYAITIAVTGSGSTSPASSTIAKYVTASGDIEAIPNAGYSFRDWDFSKTDEVNDIYCADTYTSTSNPVHIHAVHDGTLTANFTAKTYTVRFENLGADAGHKGSLDTTVTFNDTINMKGGIEVPSKSHYDFGGYYISTDQGVTLTNIQIIDANGNWNKEVSGYTGTKDNVASWVCAGDTVLYAKWTEHEYSITMEVSPAGTGTTSPASTATGKLVTESGNITATPAAGYKFKEWQFSKTGEDYDAWCADSYSSTDATIHIKAQHNGTLTAVFEPRFSLAGDKYDGTGNGGMYGWATAYDNSDAFFTVNSTSPSVNLTCTCTLEANTRYKFQVHDRYQNKNLGAGTDGQYTLEDKAYVDLVAQDKNVTFTTTGEQRYIFQIYEFNGDERPRLKILWPRKVNFGWKYQDADAGTLSEGGGGTLTVTATEDGENSSVSIGDYIMHGSSISFTANPYGDYNFAGWWTNSSYEGDPQWGPGSPTVGWTVSSEDAKAYAKFVEKTNTLSSGTTWNTGTWSAGHQPTADEVAIIPSPVQVDITTAKAKKVLIKQDGGNSGQLEIPAGKELVVRTTIKKTTDGSTYGATGYDDIIIGSTLANGNGALVMGAHDGTNKATVYFATKAKTVEQAGEKHNVNQFIGTPFNDQGAILYNYYGTKIYRFMAAHDGNLGTENEWKRVQSNEGMNGFFGYNILTNQTTEAFLEMTGTLSRTNATETISGYYNGSSNTENMFANSWVAPIYIPNFTDDDFTNIEKTIYIFNAGTPKDQAGHAMGEGNAETVAAGQYSVLPANSSVYTGLMVIPSMQAFSVFATGANPKLKFDYNELVYNPSNGTAGIVPNRAPQRTNDEDAPNVLRLAATGESGYAAKIVLLERTDFTDGYDDGWDGRFLAGDDAAPQLYAVTSDGNMAINCVPEVEGTVLGFKAGEADEVFTFSFDYDGEALYLYDTQTQTYTRVLTGNTYIFSTDDHGVHNRFILTHNAPQMPTVITNTLSDTKAVKFIENDHLYIFQNGRLYDAAGRIVK